MSVNDVNLGTAQGADVYSGVANPTAASITNDPKRDNFVSLSSGVLATMPIRRQVTDPTSNEAGAGAGPGFQGGKDAERALKSGAGVVEARPGLIESSNIPPLSGDEPGFNAPSNSTATSTGVGSTLSGGAKVAYGTLAGDQATLEQGRREFYGGNQ
ncbi:hypothetical protein FRC06_008708 [Ceratobasidium sp. 370]|nr:hypothetical protein FRC06_008708 [Ceratobasidium sp. 370]